jgi:DNA mismatch repair protein MutL
MIRRLPEEVVRKIAAGEVVVGAFSVVKELVENSLDAGAKRVDIEIRKGGKEYIRVSDDGYGMSEEEILLAIQPHTTSKISSLQDLYSISTYGFRGEALSSIVRVSRVVITSRKPAEDLGTRIFVEGGEVVKVEKVPTKTGTTVVVRDIFYNIPARRKFLKSASIEGRMVIEVVQKFMLSRPDVHITLIRDGKVVYNSPPSDLKTRVLMVIPDMGIDDLIGIDHKQEWVELKGFISKPGKWKKTRIGQYFFVNKRPVLSAELSRAAEKGYGESLPKGFHPVAVLFVEVPPNKVDVNVHPQKIEVKFSDLETVEKALIEAVKLNVSKSWKREFQIQQNKKKVDYYNIELEKDSIKEPVELLRIQRQTARVEEKFEGKWHFLMVLNDRYILAEDGEGLIIVDYHAAHERLIYEDLKKKFEEKGIDSSNLIIPIEVLMDEVLVETAFENKATLEKLGFFFERVENGVKLTAIPTIVPVHLSSEVFKEVLEGLRLSKISGMGETMKKILADMACKSAVRTGDRIDSDSAMQLLKELEMKKLLSCPHGRPLVFKLDYRELDRYFGRM